MIRLTQPCLGAEELQAAAEVIQENWIACGPRTARLEREFAACTGGSFAVACQSGTAALSLTLEALGIGPGDEVIVPSLTFSASAACVVRQGAGVRWADIRSLDCPLLDADALPALVGPRTRAVMYVAYAGYAAGLDRVHDACRRLGLRLIADATHAPGLKPYGQGIAGLCDAAAYSFHSTKNMTCGEGGMVVCADAGLAGRMRRLRDHGLERLSEMDDRGLDYRVALAGWNARISDLTAAIGLAQLSKLPAMNARRLELARLYDGKLGKLDPQLGLGLPLATRRADGVCHIYPVLLPAGTDRRSLRLALRHLGIETAVHYLCLHRQEAYARFAPASLPLTEEYSDREVTLPLHPALTEQEVDTVVQALARSLAPGAATVRPARPPAVEARP